MYRVHMTIRDQDGARISPTKVALALPSLQALGWSPGSRRGAAGYWREARKRDDFRYAVWTVYKAVDACGWTPTFQATNGPSLDALRTLAQQMPALRDLVARG